MVYQLVIFFAEYFHYVVFSIGILFIGIDIFSKKKVSVIILSVIAFILALLLDKSFGHIISSPRPFVIHDVTPLFYHIANNGFPSGHTLYATVIAGIVFTDRRKVGLLLLFFASVIGIARIFSGVHHSIDILGGIFIGVLSVYVAHRVCGLKKL